MSAGIGTARSARLRLVFVGMAWALMGSVLVATPNAELPAAAAEGTRPYGVKPRAVQVPFHVETTWQTSFYMQGNVRRDICWGGAYMVVADYLKWGQESSYYTGNYYFIGVMPRLTDGPGPQEGEIQWWNASHVFGQTSDSTDGYYWSPGKDPAAIAAFAGMSVQFAGAGVRVYGGAFDGGSVASCEAHHATMLRYAEYAENAFLWTVEEFGTDIEVTLAADVDGRLRPGDQVPLTLTLENTTDDPMTNVEFPGGGSGLIFDQTYLQLVSGPDGPVPTNLAPKEKAVLHYVVRILESGNTEITSTATGRRGAETTTDTGRAVLRVPPRVEIALTTDASSSTKVGDEFHVTATLTNTEDVPVPGIRAEGLATNPVVAVSPVSGPIGPGGVDVRAVPVAIPAKSSIDIVWTERADDKGVVDLTARVSGKDPRELNAFQISASTQVAIESAALNITELRLQPGAFVPGNFGNIRGTVTNTGTVDVTDIDVGIDGTPELNVLGLWMARQPDATKPQIAKLTPGQSREFMIPVGMVSDTGGRTKYNGTVTFHGRVDIDGESSVVTTDDALHGDLDLTDYWETVIDEIRRQLLQGTLDFFEGVNTWGDSSTLGGITVGTGDGVLAAFQKMGDGLLKASDFIDDTYADGGAHLTKQGKDMVAAIREYYNATTLKKMVIDFANVRDGITEAPVKVVGEWMRDVVKAHDEGKPREVARLFAEPTTFALIGIPASEVGGQLFSKLISAAPVRRGMSTLRREVHLVDEAVASAGDFKHAYYSDGKDLRSMATGVPIRGATVAKAGITLEEHAWMIEMAKEHGVAFFVRPRPAEAAEWAMKGFNAKPMAVKLKSINDLDVKWLGYDDLADSKGLVVLREPKDPFPAMKKAVDEGHLEWGGTEIDDIIKRYNKRKSEWKTREAFLDHLNSGDGFEIQRFGYTIKTKVRVDDRGLLIFTHNNKPVYSDIDLLSIARPDGTPIPQSLHELISEQAGFGFDSQHGDTVMTSDFGSWKDAKQYATEYATEHMRGGDPLVIVQPDVTTLGYVDEIHVPEGEFPKESGYELYGKITTTYEGAGTR